MVQAPPVFDLVRERRSNGSADYQTDWIAAYLGMNDPDSIQRFGRLAFSARDYSAQVLGNWALYRASGDGARLDFVIETAREAAGLAPRTARSEPWTGASTVAMDLLKITRTPSVTRASEEIADYAARDGSANSDLFQRAFGELFYIHQDYAFVDQRVRAFLEGQYGGSGVSATLMWRIAATRRNPETEALAQRRNETAYNFEFIGAQGRPVEGWMDMSHVPTSVLPPLVRRR